MIVYFYISQLKLNMKMIQEIGLLSMLLLAGLTAHTQAAQMDAGKKIYIKSCMVCHQNDGAGVPGLNPPLIKTDWVTGQKNRLINVILKGLEDPIEVNGEEYSNPMPPMPHLTDQEIADVLTYIRNSFGNKASAVTPAEVKALRPKK
jgi:mono/diheme cytochrome c family protein